jgi:tetratricopeptide (TPR) repeat protein
MAPAAEDRLSRMKVKELRDFAKKHKISLKGLKKKADIVSVLTAVEDIDNLLAKDEVEDLKREEEETAEIGEEVREIVEEAEKLPPLEDEEADPIIIEGKNVDVDFRKVEELVDRARMRYEEGSYAKALSLTQEALADIDNPVKNFHRYTYSYALLSAEGLIRESGKSDAKVDKAISVIMRAKKAYADGSIFKDKKVMKSIDKVTKKLYAEDVQKSKETFLSTRRFVFDVADLGADISKARDTIRRAEDAMESGNYAASLKHLAKAEKLAKEAKKQRIEDIKQAIPATKAIVEEAEHVGSDVGEAEKFLKQAKIALRNKDYILCNELTKRAEHAAMQSQHKQIQKAMELRRRQVENAQKIIMKVEPFIFEAEEYRIDVTEVKTVLEKAKGILSQGDYVNGTYFAKEAEEMARRLAPRLEEERKRRGIAKPTEGVCGACGSRNLEFYDNGWGKCGECDRVFQWSARKEGIKDRLKGIFKP